MVVQLEIHAFDGITGRFKIWSCYFPLICYGSPQIMYFHFINDIGIIFYNYVSNFQILSIPVLSSYPFIAMLSGVTLTLLINCASLVKNVLSVSLNLI